MEKRFAIISIIIMCAVFAFIFVQNTDMQLSDFAFFAGGTNNGAHELNVDGSLQTEVNIDDEIDEELPPGYEEDDEDLPAEEDLPIDDDDENGDELIADERNNDMELPIVTITMEDGGVIRLQLYPEIAPNTVNNFIYLANSGFYNGLIFHRVIPGFMIQGGCPQGTGGGNPGYSIVGEFTENNFPNNLRHERGVISMARATPFDSAGSQFFIMHADGFFLDHAYASFGRVIEGMDVVDRIAGTRLAGERPVEDQMIREITVETFGVEFPEPERLAR